VLRLNSLAWFNFRSSPSLSPVLSARIFSHASATQRLNPHPSSVPAAAGCWTPGCSGGDWQQHSLGPNCAARPHLRSAILPETPIVPPVSAAPSAPESLPIVEGLSKPDAEALPPFQLIPPQMPPVSSTPPTTALGLPVREMPSDRSLRRLRPSPLLLPYRQPTLQQSRPSRSLWRSTIRV
jgi:hypothetical protein